MTDLINTLGNTEWENILYYDEAELLMGLINGYIRNEAPGTRKNALIKVYKAVSSLRDAIVCGSINCECNEVRTAIQNLKYINHGGTDK